jgi:hypothetical protein
MVIQNEQLGICTEIKSDFRNYPSVKSAFSVISHDSVFCWQGDSVLQREARLGGLGEAGPVQVYHFYGTCTGV